MHFLNPLGWNLIIIGYSGYQNIIKEKYPYATIYNISDKHIFFDSNDIPNINIKSYNTILLDKELWQTINYETILIFQRDCIMFRPFLPHFLQYDYAGSNYLYDKAPVIGGINGGFSIRKRKTMIECIEKITWEDVNEYRKNRKYSSDNNAPIRCYNEDVFFTHACEMLCKNVPDIINRTFLCIENDFNLETSVHHGWNKNYARYYHIGILLQNSPLFSSISAPPLNLCFITSIYGNPELSCKKYTKQVILTDFICFTDNPNIQNNDWIIDTTPYHTHSNQLNIEDYYKQSFGHIPLLHKYDIIVWINNTIEIADECFMEYILKTMFDKKSAVITLTHENLSLIAFRMRDFGID
jgi:uncharacterized cysteine cluster protein YcgN (CxxCxxCC family)